MLKEPFSKFLTLSFLVCLLGNFVDQFDLYLFSSLRVLSLKDLGCSPDQILQYGVWLLNAQWIGMLLGGIGVGVLADKRGRVSMLFLSIIVYSIANLANAFVQDIHSYLLCRFFAGLGLAGELGVCITIILETLPQVWRGYGTMLLIASGHSATLLSALCANIFHWRTCYFLGGVLGFAVLGLRTTATEPELFHKAVARHVPRGRFLDLFSNACLFKKYLAGVLVIAPTGFTFSVLIVFAPELGRELGILEPIEPEKYLPLNFLAVICGDVCSGMLGQFFKSRRWVIIAYVLGLACFSGFYLSGYPLQRPAFYALMAIFGFFAGYSVLSYTVAAEQFGTHLRATVATTTPNFARASAILFTSAFLTLKQQGSAIQAARLIAMTIFPLSLVSAFFLEETYKKNLDYVDSC